MSSQELHDTKNQADVAILKMRNHLTEISKLMENIQINTSNIDDDVERCENIIKSTFAEITTILNERQDALINELRKTAKNKKLSLLLQHNELNNKYQESQDKINKFDEIIQNTPQDNTQVNTQTYASANDSILQSMHVKLAQKELLSTNFDLRFK
eukprot:409927_1